MKKRILAMLLTVCMLVLAVPVFVIPTTAAEEPAYSTSFNSTTNLPTVANGAVTWNGNWKFVNYGKVWDGSRDFVPGEDAPYSDTWAGPIGHANWDGALTCGGKFGFINYGSTNEEKFGPLGAMGGQTCTCPGKHINPDGTESDKWNATGYPTLVYTAEKTGVIDIYFDKLGNAAELTEGEFTYLVYANNELVATYTLTKVAGEEEWIYETKTLAAGDIEIERGQQVLFMVKCPEGEIDAALNGGNVLFPTIEYTSTNETFYTAFSQNKPTLSGSAPVFHGNWSFVGYTPGAANYANYTNVNKPSGWAGSLNGFNALATTTKGTTGGFYNVSAVQANYQGTGGGTLGSNTAESIAIRYVSEKSGVANISLEKLGNEANLAAGTNSFYIYVNGTKVWPLNGERNSVTGKGMIISQETKVVEGISLNLGDTIDFICENTAGRNMWGNGGSLIWGVVEFTQINNNVKVYDEMNNLPTMNEDGTITYNGNFYGVGYIKGEDGFTYDDPDSAVLMQQIDKALWSGHGICAKPDSLAWNNAAHLLIEHFNSNYFDRDGQLAVTGKSSGAIRYVAEETGTIKIDLAELGNTAPLSKGVTGFNYYVYVNGVKIWSSADSVTWTTESNGAVKKNQTLTNVPVHAGIDVDYGDTVDFIVEGIGLADDALWLGAGNVVYPKITWTKIIPKPETSANVVMNSSFALNAKVELPIGVLTDVDTVGFLVNGEEVDMIQTDVNKYAINNILKAYVQDLASDEVTIQAYYTTISGKTIYGTEITTNIIDVIQAYVNGADKAASDLAKATLNYIAEAQLYFDPTLSADDLANAILGDEDMLDFSALDFNRYDDTVIVENEDATVEFGGVSMILNSATALKFYFELPEGADIEDYAFIAMDPITMQQGLGNGATGLPAGAMVAPLQYTENGSAIAYFGSTFENMDRLYAFAVVDMANGEVVSDLLVYSPLAYAATMAEDLEVGYVCASLIALNDAIDVYTGAVATR